MYAPPPPPPPLDSLGLGQIGSEESAGGISGPARGAVRRPVLDQEDAFPLQQTGERKVERTDPSARRFYPPPHALYSISAQNDYGPKTPLVNNVRLTSVDSRGVANLYLRRDEDVNTRGRRTKQPAKLKSRRLNLSSSQLPYHRSTRLV